MANDASGRAPRGRRRLRRALLGVLAAVVVLALTAVGLGSWAATRPFPQVEGRIDVAGLESSVEVQRDARGIPTITADSSADLFFAQGFVHAQDRFWEMDFRRHLTSGRLSELFGESQRETDIFLRTLGWHEVAAQEVEMLPDEARAHYEAYAAGVNAYLGERRGGALSLEYAVLGAQTPGYEPEPWTATDSVAWLKAMAWDLRTNIEDETERALQARALSAERLSDLYPGYPFEEHPVILADDPTGAAAMTSSASAGEGSASGASAGEGSAAVPVPLPDRASEALGTVLDRVDALIATQGEGVGSNSWVVSGEFTESGSPLLANDPHLGAALPSVWTQMQLRCRTVGDACPFDVAGYSFSGLPGIVIGHNRQVAWGFTNLTTDVADLYVERVENDGYWRDGRKMPFVTRVETIEVAGGESTRIEVRETVHGPIVSGLTPDFTAIADDPRVGVGTGPSETPHSPSSREPGGTGDADRAGGTGGADGPGVAGDAEPPPGEFAVSLRWTALDPGSTAEAIFLLNTAADFDDFREAASKFDVPAQNLVYADLEGNIGYQAPGRLPIRGAGDGWMPQPGWDSAYDWRGTIPFEHLPHAYNPESGYIVTANNAIVNDDYPYFLSRDWDYGYRAARIDELLSDRIAEGPVTGADMTEIQLDNRFPAADALQRAYAGVEAPDAKTAAALRLLGEWDGQNDADSAGAAYANVLWEHVTLAMTERAAERTASHPDEPEAGDADEPEVGDADEPEAVVPVARGDQSRFARFFALQLADPQSEWFGADREKLLQGAAADATEELVAQQGGDPEKWNWGELHALELKNGTFGESGIALIEAIFNRGPYPVGGGASVVNATGWTLGEGYGTNTVPSMRMVVDLGDWDASTWQNLTGQSGHAFHRNYVDQVEGWATGEPDRWAWSQRAVDAASEHHLTLAPVS